MSEFTQFIVGVVGNPNCGKTTLFNALTGAKQQVGNWPGVTVEKKTGEYRFKNQQIQLVDLPGTYSLESTDDQLSLDEKVARDYVAAKQADLIINIVDASTIERNLYLTSQLLEMRVPMLVVLNMMDIVKRRGIKIDIEALAQRLACPVIPISAANKNGLEYLKQAIQQAVLQKPIPYLQIQYAPELESAIQKIIDLFSENTQIYSCDYRWLAIRSLEGDTLAQSIVGEILYAQIRLLQQQIETETADEIDILAADARYGLVNELTQKCVCKLHEVSRHTSEKIDRWVLNRFLGIPIFLLVMYFMFLFTINIGGAFIDFFDQVAEIILVKGLTLGLTQLHSPIWLTALLTQGIGSGIQVVASFIPIVGFLFLFLSFLEDSGYMSRAAFVMDRLMRLLGLPGKSFVPMIVGFGCNVPAIMATRTLDNQRDRILTNLMNPFMSCGARLPVYALFSSAFFPTNGQNMVFGLYLLGIVIAVMTGLIMRFTLFKGEVTPFIMELPAYHLPILSSVILRTWDRLRSFLVNAGKIIIPMVLVLNSLNAVNIKGDFQLPQQQDSILHLIGQQLTPAFEPLGIHAENWQATVGIFTGILAKEAVVGTLNTLYSQAEFSKNNQDNQQFNLKANLLAALMTIPEHFNELSQQLLDPLGLNINQDSTQMTDIKQQLTFDAMQKRFDGQVGALAYLIFILLYSPCVAATAAIYRETTAGWAFFTVCWTTGLAYFCATLFYQSATFTQHPLISGLWISALMIIFITLLFMLWLYGRQRSIISSEY
ncbi:MAG: hypothetical protein RL637_534 [Pseudomonadota bacterium]|jgi:ferrous iron transport protein B